MIITDSKPFGLIKAKLKKTDRIGIVSCNSCVQKCETGGIIVMKGLTARLKKSGFDVVDTDLIGMACDYDLLKKDKLKGDVTIVLACDAGVYNLKKLLPKRKVIAALDTIGLGSWDEKGNLTLVRRF